MIEPFLSVVVPSYNEQKNIDRGVLEEIIAYLEKQTFEWELVFTDDGSTDGTVEELRKFRKQHADAPITVVENPHKGKGPTVSAGMLAARGKYRLYTDFDQSTPLSEVEKFFPFIDDGYDIIIGSRALAGARREKEPIHRHIMGKGFNILVQIIAVSGIHDTQCGFKMFSAQATEHLFPSLKIYKGTVRMDAFTGAFDVELLFLGRRHGYSIAEVPVLWFHNETDRVSPIKDSVRMLRDILRIRWAGIQGVYNDAPRK
jgi:glycosyltransferase involved in cell wall biosynthesis